MKQTLYSICFIRLILADTIYWDTRTVISELMLQITFRRCILVENFINHYLHIHTICLGSITVMANAPHRFLTWRWEDEDDENRLVYTADSKKPNAGTFILAKEDHTIGNLMRLQLLRDPSVRFAGYRMPHPLIFDCHIRVETMDSRSRPTRVTPIATIFITKTIGYRNTVYN